MPGLNVGEGEVTEAIAQPAWWRVLGVPLAGWGSRRCHLPKRRPFWFSGGFFWGWDEVLLGWFPLSLLVTGGEPTSGHRDVCSVGIPGRAFGGEKRADTR